MPDTSTAIAGIQAMFFGNSQPAMTQVLGSYLANNGGTKDTGGGDAGDGGDDPSATPDPATAEQPPATPSPEQVIPQLTRAIGTHEWEGQKPKYDSQNGINAIGAYQIMPATLFQNASKYIPDLVSSVNSKDQLISAFRANPAAQDQFASGLIGDLYQKNLTKYGGDPVQAARWTAIDYYGHNGGRYDSPAVSKAIDPKTGKPIIGESPNSYADKVLGHLAQMGPDTTGNVSSGDSSSPNEPAQPGDYGISVLKSLGVDTTSYVGVLRKMGLAPPATPVGSPSSVNVIQPQPASTLPDTSPNAPPADAPQTAGAFRFDQHPTRPQTPKEAYDALQVQRANREAQLASVGFGNTAQQSGRLLDALANMGSGLQQMAGDTTPAGGVEIGVSPEEHEKQQADYETSQNPWQNPATYDPKTTPSGEMMDVTTQQILRRPQEIIEAMNNPQRALHGEGADDREYQASQQQAADRATISAALSATGQGMASIVASLGGETEPGRVLTSAALEGVQLFGIPKIIEHAVTDSRPIEAVEDAYKPHTEVGQVLAQTAGGLLQFVGAAKLVGLIASPILESIAGADAVQGLSETSLLGRGIRSVLQPLEGTRLYGATNALQEMANVVGGEQDLKTGIAKSLIGAATFKGMDALEGLPIAGKAAGTAFLFGAQAEANALVEGRVATGSEIKSAILSGGAFGGFSGIAEKLGASHTSETAEQEPVPETADNAVQESAPQDIRPTEEPAEQQETSSDTQQQPALSAGESEVVRQTRADSERISRMSDEQLAAARADVTQKQNGESPTNTVGDETSVQGSPKANNGGIQGAGADSERISRMSDEQLAAARADVTQKQNGESPTNTVGDETSVQGSPKANNGGIQGAGANRAAAPGEHASRAGDSNSDSGGTSGAAGAKEVAPNDATLFSSSKEVPHGGQTVPPTAHKIGDIVDVVNDEGEPIRSGEKIEDVSATNTIKVGGQYYPEKNVRVSKLPDWLNTGSEEKATPVAKKPMSEMSDKEVIAANSPSSVSEAVLHHIATGGKFNEADIREQVIGKNLSAGSPGDDFDNTYFGNNADGTPVKDSYVRSTKDPVTGNMIPKIIKLDNAETGVVASNGTTIDRFVHEDAPVLLNMADEHSNMSADEQQSWEIDARNDAIDTLGSIRNKGDAIKKLADIYRRRVEPGAAGYFKEEDDKDANTEAWAQKISESKNEPTGSDGISLKNKVTDPMRSEAGAPARTTPKDRGEVEHDADLHERVNAEFVKNPNVGKNLVNELHESPRTVDNHEVEILNHELVASHNEFKSAMDDANDPNSKTNPAMAAQRLKEAREHYYDVFDTVSNTTSSMGAAFRGIQRMMNDDFTPASMEAQVRASINEGRAPKERITELPDDVRAKIKDIYDQKLKSDARAEKAEADVNNFRTDTNVNQVLDQLTKQLKTSTSKAKQSAAESIKTGKKFTFADDARARLHSGAQLYDVTGWLADAATVGAEHIANGAVAFAEWSKKVVEDVGERVIPYLEHLFKLSKAQAEDITAPAKGKDMSPEAVLSRNASKFEEGALPQRAVFNIARAHLNNGVPRDDVMKRTTETIQKVRPDISERDVRVAFSGYGKMQFPSQQADLKTLRELRSIEQLHLKTEAVVNHEEVLRSGSQRDKPTADERTATLELRQAMRDHGYDTRGDSKRTIASNLARYKTYLQNSTGDVEARIERAKTDPSVYAKPVRVPPTLDIEATAAKVENMRVKQSFRDLQEQYRLQNRSFTEKTIDYLTGATRFGKLTGLSTLNKLLDFSLVHIPLKFAEEVAGGAIGLVGKVPGFHFLSDLSEGAPIEGGMDLGAVAKGVASAWTEGVMKDARDIYKTGSSELDILGGSHGHDISGITSKSPHWMELAGMVHGMEKSPLRREAFTIAMEKSIKQKLSHGIDVSDPMIKQGIQLGAVRAADADILRDENMYASGLTSMFQRWDNWKDKATGKPKIAGKLGAFGGRLAIPFARIQANHTVRTLNYGFGLLNGATKLVGAAREAAHEAGQRNIFMAFREGVAGMNDAERDAVMRNLKLGSIGAAGTLMAWYAPTSVIQFGGLDPRRKRVAGEPGLAGVSVMGHVIPGGPAISASPFVSWVQAVATLKQALDGNEATRQKAADLGTASVLSLFGIVEQAPVANQALEFSKLLEPNGVSSYTGNLIRSNTIPIIAQEAAQGLDPRKVDADGNPVTLAPNEILPNMAKNLIGLGLHSDRLGPKGVLQNVTTGVPVLRNKVRTRTEAKEATREATGRTKSSEKMNGTLGIHRHNKSGGQYHRM